MPNNDALNLNFNLHTHSPDPAVQAFAGHPNPDPGGAMAMDGSGSGWAKRAGSQVPPPDSRHFSALDRKALDNMKRVLGAEGGKTEQSQSQSLHVVSVGPVLGGSGGPLLGASGGSSPQLGPLLDPLKLHSNSGGQLGNSKDLGGFGLSKTEDTADAKVQQRQLPAKGQYDTNPLNAHVHVGASQASASQPMGKVSVPLSSQSVGGNAAVTQHLLWNLQLQQQQSHLHASIGVDHSHLGGSGSNSNSIALAPSPLASWPVVGPVGGINLGTAPMPQPAPPLSNAGLECGTFQIVCLLANISV